LSDTQVDFREERDTIDGIYVLKIAVNREITEDKGKAALLFADMKGAFDNLKREEIKEDRRILKEIKIDCYVARLDMDRVSNRLSRSSSVIYESSHLPDGTYNVSTSAWLPSGREFQKRRFDPFFNFTKKSAYAIIDASGGVIPERGGGRLPERTRNLC
jgi:hypothetical protein